MVSAPISFREWWHALHGPGSPATAFDDLPRCVAAKMPGWGAASLLAFCQLHRDESANPLNWILHLCLVKKEPSWLVRNNRPILLEPFLRRAECKAMFVRLQRSGERHQWFSPSPLAYQGANAGSQSG